MQNHVKQDQLNGKMCSFELILYLLQVLVHVKVSAYITGQKKVLLDSSAPGIQILSILWSIDILTSFHDLYKPVSIVNYTY